MGKGNRLAQNVSTPAYRKGHDYVDWTDYPPCPQCKRRCAVHRGIFVAEMTIESAKDAKVKNRCSKCGYIYNE